MSVLFNLMTYMIVIGYEDHETVQEMCQRACHSLPLRRGISLYLVEE